LPINCLKLVSLLIWVERMKKIGNRTFKNFIQRGRSERQEEAYPCGTLTLSSDMRTKLGKFFRVLMER
jgi:hypothetical protein